MLMPHQLSLPCKFGILQIAFSRPENESCTQHFRGSPELIPVPYPGNWRNLLSSAISGDSGPVAEELRKVSPCPASSSITLAVGQGLTAIGEHIRYNQSGSREFTSYLVRWCNTRVLRSWHHDLVCRSKQSARSWLVAVKRQNRLYRSRKPCLSRSFCRRPRGQWLLHRKLQRCKSR